MAAPSMLRILYAYLWHGQPKETVGSGRQRQLSRMMCEIHLSLNINIKGDTSLIINYNMKPAISAALTTRELDYLSSIGSLFP